jgi:hypothetical protein
MMGAKVAGVMAPAMVVPWYENGDVLAYLQSAQGVNPVDLAGQVASGLKHLHTLGVVHGNVYPVRIRFVIYMHPPYQYCRAMS